MRSNYDKRSLDIDIMVELNYTVTVTVSSLSVVAMNQQKNFLFYCSDSQSK